MMSSQTKSSNTSSRLRASSTKSMVTSNSKDPLKTSITRPTPKPGVTTLNHDHVSAKPRRPNCGERLPQFLSKPRRQKKTEDEKNNDKKEQVLLQDEINKELMIKDLEGEVVRLKSELDKALAFNQQLQLQNQKLTQELAAAHANIAPILSTQRDPVTVGEHRNPKFKDIRKLIANKLECPVAKKDSVGEASIIRKPSSSLSPPPISPSSKVIAIEKKSPIPPPPPPPPPFARAPTNQKAPTFLEFYHSLTKKEGKRNSPPGLGNPHKQATISAHNSIVDEIQNRSAHLLAVKADIDTKGEFINSLIAKVQDAAYTDIEDVVKFVDWLDGELATLADERAVLKHFKWPERKADAFREAAVEYRELKLLETEISSYTDVDTDILCTSSLKKMASLLDKSERSVQKLIKLRSSVLCSYQELKIPTDWMLDSGIMIKIKQGSINLVKLFMKRVRLEWESIQNSDRETLLLQGVNFAYRAHQFAGGLDSETLCAFEEIRQSFPQHLRGSRDELLPAIPSS